MAQVETELGEVVHEFRLGHRGRWLALQALVLGIAMLSLAMGGLALMLMPQPTALALVVARIMVGGGVAVLLVGAVLVCLMVLCLVLLCLVLLGAGSVSGPTTPAVGCVADRTGCRDCSAFGARQSYARRRPLGPHERARRARGSPGTMA